MQHTEGNLKNHPTSGERDDAKPVTIYLTSGDEIHAPDHETHDGWVIVFRGETTGIDKKIPRESILFIDRQNGGEGSW